MAKGSPRPEPKRPARYYGAVLAQLSHGPVIIGLAAAAVLIGAGVVVHVATRPHKLQAIQPNKLIQANRPQQPSSSGLPACASSTATGCDRSKLHAGTRGSSACHGNGPGTSRWV
jgi:hypothetical protein